MSMQVFGGSTAELLTASDEALTLDYQLLTYGEEGFTSKGKCTVGPGALKIPAGHLPINDEHTPDKPVGFGTMREESDRVLCSAHFFRTPEGEAAYAAAKDGTKRGISMEVLNPVIRGGKLLAGLLCGAGVVARPAFPSSMLLASDFSDVEPEALEDADEDLDAARAALDAGDLEAAAAAIKAAQDKLNPTPEPKDEDAVPKPKTENLNAGHSGNADPVSRLLAGLQSMTGSTPAPEASGPASVAEFAASFRSGLEVKDEKLKASHFATMTQTDIYDPTTPPAWLGELWNTTEYQEVFAPLVAHEGLTAMKYEGWRWVEGDAPVVDDWEPAFTDETDEDGEIVNGNAGARMNPIPTGKMRAESKNFYAKRIAGGRRFDRVYRDFPTPGVMESFLRMEAETIKKKRDLRVRAELLRQAALTGRTIRGGAGDHESTWARIIFGAMATMDYARPDFALVGNDIYRELLRTDMLENLALLEVSLGLESGSMSGFRIQPAPMKDAAFNGRVLVGASRATVLHEPAGAPIRVDAQDLAVGAIDEAVFSYYMLRSDDRGGLVEVPGASA